MPEELYRVVLTGYSTDKGEHYIEEDIANLFNIKLEKAKELFSSLPTTLNENLSSKQANQFKDAIEKTGALCDLENMRYNFTGLSVED